MLRLEDWKNNTIRELDGVIRYLDLGKPQTDCIFKSLRMLKYMFDEDTNKLPV